MTPTQIQLPDEVYKRVRRKSAPMLSIDTNLLFHAFNEDSLSHGYPKMSNVKN
jgi:hypothetical protein